jgi:hypothetical protein
MVPKPSTKWNSRLMWLGARALVQNFLEPEAKERICQWIRESVIVATPEVTSVFPRVQGNEIEAFTAAGLSTRMEIS